MGWERGAIAGCRAADRLDRVVEFGLPLDSGEHEILGRGVEIRSREPVEDQVGEGGGGVGHVSSESDGTDRCRGRRVRGGWPFGRF